MLFQWGFGGVLEIGAPFWSPSTWQTCVYISLGVFARCRFQPPTRDHIVVRWFTPSVRINSFKGLSLRFFALDNYTCCLDVCHAFKNKIMNGYQRFTCPAITSTTCTRCSRRIVSRIKAARCARCAWQWMSHLTLVNVLPSDVN